MMYIERGQKTYHANKIKAHLPQLHGILEPKEASQNTLHSLSIFLLQGQFLFERMD